MAISRMRLWGLVLAGVFIAYTAITLVYLQPGPGTPHEPGIAPLPLMAVTDLTEFLLMIGAALLALRNAFRFQGRAKLFWLLMFAGFFTWGMAQSAWIYFDIIVRRPLPDPFWGDVVLFFHFVPLTAALIVRPHRPGQVRNFALPAIDWSMLLLWWLFLYVFLVFPWQFIHLNIPRYDSAFNLLYLAEDILWLVILLVACVFVRNKWRRLYLLLLFGGLAYTGASQLIDHEIRIGNYYSGSLYDIPLVAAMMVFIWAMANAPTLVDMQESDVVEDAHEAEAFGPRLAMLALLSIPVIVTWMELKADIHGDIFRFRAVVSMVTIVAMGALVFVKQFLLDLERLRLIHESRTNFSNLQRLQAQLVQNEKLASLGQLVSGAAHEINNPLTAILGYAELMEYDARADQTLKSHAGKIKQQALRTKDLVTNLLRFARQPGGEKRPLDFNRLVENSIRARESETENKSVTFLRELSPALPPVVGDEKQLVDVCMQLLGNAAEILAPKGDGRITARTYQDADWIVLEINDNGPGISEPARVFDPFYTTRTIGQGTGLGLSICYGIVADHKGFIFAENLPGGGARLVVRLPIAPGAKAGSSIASSHLQN